MFKRILILFAVFAAILFVSCHHDPLDVDVTDVKLPPMKTLRLDRDLFTLTVYNAPKKTDELLSKYGPFYEHYLKMFLCRKGTYDSAYVKSVVSFVNDRDVRETQGYIQKIFTDEKMNEIEEQLEDMRHRIAHYFPDKNAPSRLITCLTGWNFAFTDIDSAFVVGLDMYLGDTAKFYQMLQYQKYQVRKMNPRYMLTDIARGWLLSNFDTDDAQNTLLHHTIFYGKLFYAMKALLPKEEDSVLIGYTSKQMEYCRQYQKNLWGYFAEKNRLYENDLAGIRELTTDGPFTAAISRECPPRIAMWVGWQIVKSYMEHNEKVTLDQLMKEKDVQAVLTKSRYRP